MQQKEANSRVLVMMRLVSLPDAEENMKRYPHQLSGGMRQHVMVAMALICGPKLLFADEPTAALDVTIQAQIVNLMMKLQQERGLAYLFITHDLSMVRQISDRIAVMVLGTIMDLAPSDELYRHHQHPYTKAMLSAIPIPNPKVERERKRIVLSGDVASPVNMPQQCRFCKRCPLAQKQCFESVPALKEIETGHFVACHLV